jgi:sugar O-acyltransferase (sialic acid O-acetyltransferase NeuD family)
MKPELILVGGGGHCHSVIDTIEESDKFRIAGIIDVKERVGEKILGYQIIGSDADLERFAREYTFFLVTVGQIKNVAPRLRIYELLRSFGAVMASIVSPRAHVSRHAHIGAGSVVLHGATVNSGAITGENCIINCHSLIEHGVVTGSHCHISTGSIINGDTRIGDRTFIGSGAVIKQGVEIGCDCIIGAGSVIMKNIPDGTIFRPDSGSGSAIYPFPL